MPLQGQIGVCQEQQAEEGSRQRNGRCKGSENKWWVELRLWAEFTEWEMEAGRGTGGVPWVQSM